MITLTQITNTEIFTFIAVPVFKLLSRTEQVIETVKREATFYEKSKFHG